MYVDNMNLLSEPGWKIFRQVADEYHPLLRPPHVSKMSTPDQLQMYLTRTGFVDVKIGTTRTSWSAGQQVEGRNRHPPTRSDQRHVLMAAA
jgi:hypothetical protein